MGKSASYGEEAVLADSGQEGEITAGDGRVRRATFSASYYIHPATQVKGYNYAT